MAVSTSSPPPPHFCHGMHWNFWHACVCVLEYSRILCHGAEQTKYASYTSSWWLSSSAWLHTYLQVPCALFPSPLHLSPSHRILCLGDVHCQAKVPTLFAATPVLPSLHLILLKRGGPHCLQAGIPSLLTNIPGAPPTQLSIIFVLDSDVYSFSSIQSSQPPLYYQAKALVEEELESCSILASTHSVHGSPPVLCHPDECLYTCLGGRTW